MIKKIVSIFKFNNNYGLKDEDFMIDFLYDKQKNKTIKKAKIEFPEHNQYIIINGEKSYFDTYGLEYEGLSSDNKYHKVSTIDYRFWIAPKDYKRFMKVVKRRHKIKMENRRKRTEHIKINNRKKVEYDPMDEDIYNCFIAHKSSMTSEIGTWEQFYKVEGKIAEICKENNGRYYKTPTKNAKFAIIFSYVNRVHSSVSNLREKGYKVTTFEKALEYFGLTYMWDIDTLVRMEKEHKEFMKKNYK